MTAAVPDPRDPSGPYRICLVCLGNICRSPTAEIVLRSALERAGLSEAVQIDSAGTGDWHVDHPIDKRAGQALRERGYDGAAHRARQFDRTWFAERDLVLAMDADNLRDLRRLERRTHPPLPGLNGVERVQMFRAFDPQLGPGASQGDLEVPDPYYGGTDGFEHVLSVVEATADGLAEALEAKLRC